MYLCSTNTVEIRSSSTRVWWQYSGDSVGDVTLLAYKNRSRFFYKQIRNSCNNNCFRGIISLEAEAPWRKPRLKVVLSPVGYTLNFIVSACKKRRKAVFCKNKVVPDNVLSSFPWLRFRLGSADAAAAGANASPTFTVSFRFRPVIISRLMWSLAKSIDPSLPW